MASWGWAEWALSVLGFAVPGLVVLVAARHVARRLSPPARGLKWVGVYVGAAAAYPLVLFVFTSFCIKPYFGSRAVSQNRACQENLRRLSTALLLYAQDCDGTLPPADRWGDLSARYLPGRAEAALRCPAARTPYGYAFNRALDARPLAQIPEPGNTVMLFEADAALRNTAGGRELWLPEARHAWRNAAAADGTVRHAGGASGLTLSWDVTRRGAERSR